MAPAAKSVFSTVRTRQEPTPTSDTMPTSPASHTTGIPTATPEELWTLSETAGGLYMLNLYEDDLYALYDTPVWPEG